MQVIQNQYYEDTCTYLQVLRERLKYGTGHRAGAQIAYPTLQYPKQNIAAMIKLNINRTKYSDI